MIRFESLKESFNAGKMRPLANRKTQLKALLRFLCENEQSIYEALKADLCKPEFETLIAEIGLSRLEIRHALAHLGKWAEAKRVPTPITQVISRSWYRYEPKGVVLILAPWNFPLQLVLSPLVGAISAGNCAIIKPSEHAPATSHLLTTLLPKYLDPECFQVVEGAHDVSHELLQLPFDHIFFTGSTRIGKIVMQEAAKHLTPVTLELGGKCPCIVDETANIALAAKRLLWGKLINSGQVCLAPDFLLVHRSKTSELIGALKQTVAKFYTDNVKSSADYTRIVSKEHALRLKSLLTDQQVIFGGEVDVDGKFMSPTFVLNPPVDSKLMREEIFGPILPIIEYSDTQDILSMLSQMERPLAMYVFSANPETIRVLSTQTASGAFCINDTVSHVGVLNLGFGGVGASGFGTYHGEDGFQTFSYKRAYFKKSTWFDLPMRYAPYSRWKSQLAALFLR